MFDMSPDAPAEIRGSFQPIATTVPGIQVCEHRPRLAALVDKFAVIRSITGLAEEHRTNQSDSGWSEKSLAVLGGRPGIGVILPRFRARCNLRRRLTNLIPHPLR
jgi:hypothetical protein